MGKATLFGLLLVLVTTMIMTTSFVYSSPTTQSGIEKVPPVVSKEKDSSSSEEDSDSDDDDSSEDSSESMGDKERILCNVIVRATHDLQVYQNKSADEITNYLNMDCKNLGDEELIEQCHEMVDEYGANIYKHVMNGIELSEVCKKIKDHNEIDLDDMKIGECAHKDKNKCQCCKMHVRRRKMLLRFMVKKIAKKHMRMCEKSPRPYRCRCWIRHKKRRALMRIRNICPRAVCRHLGYCKKMSEDNGANKLWVESKIDSVADSPSLLPELLLDQQLETHFTKDVCNEFEQLQTLCVHLTASIDSRRYAKIYMAVLDNDITWIDDDLREKARSTQDSANVDSCSQCKNIAQSSTNFYIKNLETVGNALDRTCEQYSEEEKCEGFFKKELDTIDIYLHSMTPDVFCSIIRLCSLNSDGQCTTCVQRFQSRKDAAAKAIDRLSVYFTDQYTKLNIPQSEQYISEVMTEVLSFIKEFDLQDACLAMGLCGQNVTHAVDDYEHAFIEDIGKEVCSMLGPFKVLCQQIVQGNSIGVQTVNFNAASIDNFLMQCEEIPDKENTVTTTTGQCSEDKDKCQCCIERVIQKKKCLKKRVAKYIWHMARLCKRCPAREKCEHYWEEKKACWDAKIDKICPKQVCIRRGYCQKIEINNSVQPKTEVKNEKQPTLNKL